MGDEQPSSAPAAEPVSTDPVDQVINYHIRTKHHFNRYARSLGFLDWVNQPDPFRRYEGAPLFPLPLLKADEAPVSPAYDAIYEHGHVILSLSACELFLGFLNGLSPCRRGKKQGTRSGRYG